MGDTIRTGTESPPSTQATLRRRGDGLLLRGVNRIHELGHELRVLYRPERQLHRKACDQLHSATGCVVMNRRLMLIAASASANHCGSAARIGPLKC